MEVEETGRLEISQNSGPAGVPAHNFRGNVHARSPRRFPVPKSPKIKLAWGNHNRTPRKSFTAAGRTLSNAPEHGAGYEKDRGQARAAAAGPMARSKSVGAFQGRVNPEKAKWVDVARAPAACEEKAHPAAAVEKAHRRRLILSASEDEPIVDPPKLKKEKAVMGGRKRLVKAATKAVIMDDIIVALPNISPPSSGQGEPRQAGHDTNKKKGRAVARRKHKLQIPEGLVPAVGEGTSSLSIKTSSPPRHTADGVTVMTPSSALVDLAASLSEEEDNCFEIKGWFGS
ncbi:unnamed protein product [Linum trigynum]|uniref:Uncharacterized protein n=1 Tax=Linum trigynum TaxID=586398 RepID=A0AAV2GCW9_9ROSI